MPSAVDCYTRRIHNEFESAFPYISDRCDRTNEVIDFVWHRWEMIYTIKMTINDSVEDLNFIGKQQTDSSGKVMSIRRYCDVMYMYGVYIVHKDMKMHLYR